MTRAAVERARVALDLAPGEDFPPDALSVLLECAIVAALEWDDGALVELRRRLRAEPATEERLARRVLALADDLDPRRIRDLARDAGISRAAPVLAALDAQHAAARRRWAGRLAVLALEQVRGERVAPPLRIRLAGALERSDLRGALTGRHVLGVVFRVEASITNEVFPLMLDAYAQGLVGPGGRLVDVVAVHADWLDERGRARRLIYHRPVDESLHEADLSLALPIDACLFRALGRDESAEHERLAGRLAGRLMVNAPVPSRRADDKWETYRRLARGNVATPATALVGREDSVDTALVARVQGEIGGGPLVVQPRWGTEGRGVEVLPDPASELVPALTRLQREHGDLIVRPLVGGVAECLDLRLNVVWDGRRFVAESGYAQVAPAASTISSVGRGGRIVSLSEGALAIARIDEEELGGLARLAESALSALHAEGRPGDGRLGLAGVDVRVARQEAGLASWVLDLNPRPAGLSHSEYLASREPGVTLGMWNAVAAEADSEKVLTLIRQDSDEDHRALLDGLADAGLADRLIDRLVEYLRQQPGGDADPRLLLLQERAILVLGDVLWREKRRGRLPERPALDAALAAAATGAGCREAMLRALQDPVLATTGHASEEDYLAFINQFTGAVNEREMRDFALARRDLLERVGASRRGRAEMVAADCRHQARVPMRVGLSSANASDNWTFSKLRGGRVVNFAVDLASGSDEAPHPPICVTLETLAEPVLDLSTVSHLETDRPTRLVLSGDRTREFLALAPGQQPAVEHAFRDLNDPLLLLKYAFVFSGIVRFAEDPAGYLAEPERVLGDVRRFAGGRGLRLTVRSDGPSRAGFASSSCVALGLLRVLYEASGQQALIEPEILSSMALLLENEVGLKSGKQDTDGPLYPGVKALEYRPTTGFLVSQVRPLALDERRLCENLMLVNSGIERPPATGLRRGLNMRHYSYLSRDPRRFPAVMRSLEVHESIVGALQGGDWARLGALFGEYLDLRATIDPGATESRFDSAAGRSVLRLPIERLREAGLIHGGMYTGAMGGGCMMLVATERGRESVPSAAGETTRLAQALLELKEWRAADARPFAGLEAYRYAINSRGLEYERQAQRP